MHCYIYRSRKKTELYLFLAEENNFDEVPKTIMDSFGEPEKSMELEVTESMKFVRTDAKTLLNNLKQHGFHIQLPPADPHLQIYR